MFRALRLLLLFLFVVLLGAAGVIGVWMWRSGDPEYAVYETVFNARFHRYDAVIQSVAKRQGVDPMVVKAVVWRESRFRPDKVGQDGERGLMQITDAAAREWAKSEKVASFVPTDLFDPKVNIETGTWLLARALRRYESKADPLTFALAEYNAGRGRVARWTGEKDKDPAQTDPVNTRQELQARINIASTRSYIDTVQNRVQFYHQRGRL